MRLGFLTAHSDTPTLPRCPWRSQKYTVPVCAIVCRISATDMHSSVAVFHFPCLSERQSLAGERVPPRI